MGIQARILIVDDERTLREILSVALTRCGHECEVAINGSEGLEVASKRAFDLVLTDLKMPGMAGLEFVRRLRREQPDIPVIIMTGYADLDSARKALRMNVTDYLVKPFEGLAEVQNAVQRALESRPKGADTRTLFRELERFSRESRQREKGLTQRLERSRAEVHSLARRLEQSEVVAARQLEQIEDLVHDMDKGILLADAGGAVLSLNRELRRQLGIPNSHGVGFSVDRIPGDSGLRGALVESQLNGRMGVEDSVEVEVIDGSGEQCVYSVRSAPLTNQGGATVGIVSTVREMRRRSRGGTVSAVADGAGQ